MSKKIIDNIVWWIPNKNIRDKIRKYFNTKSSFDRQLSNFDMRMDNLGNLINFNKEYFIRQIKTLTPS